MKDPKEYLSQISKLEPSKQVIDTLVALLREAYQEIQQLKDELWHFKEASKKEVQLLKDEIAVLKKINQKPKIEPSKLEKDSKPADRSNWSKNSKNDKLVIDEEIKIEVPTDKVPLGATFKGYKKFIVQELIITTKVVEYSLAQWQKLDGGYVMAEMPKENGNNHFGPGLRAYVVNQYVAGRVPQNRIVRDLLDKGISISEGQINNILLEEAEALKSEKEAMLLAGLQSKHFQTDDTGARHKKKNGFTNVICNKFFAYFKSSDSKSRINFLEILCSNNIEYVIASETIDYLEGFKTKPATLTLLQQYLNTKFTHRQSWDDFLKKHQFGKITCRLLTEGALIGALMARGTLTLKMILMSDGAGQFDLFKHVLCWIHIERSIKRLIPLNEQDRKEINQVLDLFWDYYKDLKVYKISASEIQETLKQGLIERFNTIFSFQATELPLSMALKKIRDCKAELLLVLDHPDIPLHNNASESDIREFVTKRKVSGGTRSDAGRDARDTFISLYKTCRKLGISFYGYLDDRIRQKGNIASLADLIRKKILISQLTDLIRKKIINSYSGPHS